jgi:hypothetical protein
MNVEITPLGWLTLLALGAALTLGGQASLGGFGAFLSVGPESATLGFTPTVVAHVATYDQNLQGGITLGGTIVVSSPKSATDCLPRCQQVGRWLEGWRQDILEYELGHLQGWSHYGLEYALKAIAENCRYDPRMPWLGNVCPNRERPPMALEPRTGAFEIKWEWGSR